MPLLTSPAQASRRRAAATARWAVRHAVPRLMLGRAARRGDPLGRMATDRRLREDPFPTYRQLRERGPLVPSAFGLTSATHEVCAAVLRSSDVGVGMDLDAMPAALRRPMRWALTGAELDSTGVVDPPSLLAVDAPDHTRLRRLVSRAFTPRATAAFEPVIQRTCDELLDALATSDGPVDLVQEWAAPLPVLVIAELLGVPVERKADFLRWGAAAAATLDAGLPYRRYLQAEQGLREMHTFLREHFARLRREPGEDLVSTLVQLPPEEALTERELHATVLLLLGAGFETTVNLLGNAVVLLDAHREQWHALAEQPAGWDVAVEEVLRFDSPVQLTGRVARADIEVGGVAVRRGSFLTLLLGGANRDPAVFDDPDRFDTTREGAREHLAFSGGVHYCVGAGLARLEAVVGLRTLTERFPDLTVAGRSQRRDLQTLRGFDTLPVRLR